MFKSASTSGAGVLSHRHLYKRLGDFIGRRRLSIAERPHTRLAAGTLGSAASPTLGERSRLALSCSLELGDLLVQLFVGRRQLRNLPLQLRDQPHQLVALRGREVFGLTHSQSIKTCSTAPRPLATIDALARDTGVLPPTVLQNVAVRASSRDFSPGPVPNASARAGAAPGGHRTASAEAAALQVAPWPASPIAAR